MITTTETAQEKVEQILKEKKEGARAVRVYLQGGG
jgi:Fe-S cluster assembly iron-binding protein IscA